MINNSISENISREEYNKKQNKRRYNKQRNKRNKREYNKQQNKRKYQAVLVAVLGTPFIAYNQQRITGVGFNGSGA